MFDAAPCERRRGDRRENLEHLRGRVAALDAVPASVDSGESLLGALCAVGDAAGSLGDVDWAGLEGPVLLGAVGRLERILRSLGAAKCAALEAVDRVGASEKDCGLRPPGWFAHDLGGDPGDARRCIRAGRVLRRFTALGDALARGETSFEHVMALTNALNPRNVERLLAVEEQLVRAAAGMTVKAFAAEVRRLALLADDDGAEPREERAHATVGRGPQDELILRCLYDGTTAETLAQIIAAEVDVQRRRAWTVHEATGEPMPTAGRLRADAIRALIERGAAVGYGDSRRARTEAVIVIPAGEDACRAARTLDGRPLSPAVAELLGCDAYLQALVVDHRGQPIWLGRSKRLAPPAVRLALAVRDGGCVFRGCDMPAEWCDAHHVPPWGEGGRTDPGGMVLLCRHHHGLAHSRRWELRPVRPDQPDPSAPPGQRFEWHDHHTGRTHPANQRGLKHGP